MVGDVSYGKSCIYFTFWIYKWLKVNLNVLKSRVLQGLILHTHFCCLFKFLALPLFISSSHPKNVMLTSLSGSKLFKWKNYWKFFCRTALNQGRKHWLSNTVLDCSRGDPEKANYHFGQNALHVAAGKGHLACVTFLVGFDTNLWALDLDMRTALQVAAVNTRKDVVEFLDKAMAKQEMTNK